MYEYLQVLEHFMNYIVGRGVTQVFVFFFVFKDIHLYLIFDCIPFRPGVGESGIQPGSLILVTVCLLCSCERHVFLSFVNELEQRDILVYLSIMDRHQSC